MLKVCSKDLPAQLVNERKVLFAKMLKKLGLQETTDSNGNKVLSSIEGAERKLPQEHAKKLMKRLTMLKGKCRSRQASDCNGL
jgi:hypothetical protein